jgi:glycerol-3-phosphate cytidylyltransferase
MKYCFDLDETLCATPTSRKYADAVPYYPVIDRVNQLHDEGHHITIYTARGGTSKINHNELTTSQLNRWGVKYDRLIDTGKPDWDIFIDDKAINSIEWRNQEGIQLVGFVASSFDLLHAGHCLYLKEAKSVCDYLVAALQTDPTLDRVYKNKPVQSIEERKIQLESNTYVDEVVVYDTESDLCDILKHLKPDIRILGSDAIGKPITGIDFCKQIRYHVRNHDWSSTQLKERINNETK